MSSLRPAQICVIDDEPKEYRKILKILNQIGLGCIHIKGDTKDSLPHSPIRGIRVVFLDLHLGSDEFSATDYAKAARVFSGVVEEKESAPVAVIIWSKHLEDTEKFRDALFKNRPSYRGRLLISQLPEKPQDGSGGNAAVLKERVLKILEDFFPMSLFWSWDSMVHDASRGMQGELMRLVRQQAGELPSDFALERRKLVNTMKGTLKALLKAEAGEELTQAVAARSLVGVFGALHEDRLNHLDPSDVMARAGELVGDGGADISEETRAALNSMLLFAPTHSRESFQPGTLYVVTNKAKFSEATGLSFDKLTRLLYGTKRPGVEKLQKRLEWDKGYAAWVGQCRPILLEISPVCDVAQGKRIVARCVAGILVPKEKGHLAKSGAREAVCRLHPILLHGVRGIQIPLLFSGLVIPLELKVTPRYIKPIGRIREPLLTDLRNWCSSQASRVGYTFLA